MDHIFHPLAGQPVPPELLPNIPRLIRDYYELQPDPNEPEQKVIFGTSGHRGTSYRGTFNENHILAITQAIVCYRREKGINGPLFLGMDTHALSESAFATALSVLLANDVETFIAADDGYTPTPAVSHAILSYNRIHGHKGLADGIIITPSHNPPTDGGFKYNPPNGGPSEDAVTAWIAQKANQFLQNQLVDVKTIPLSKALVSPKLHRYDYLHHYVQDLVNILDMDVISQANMRLAADALGGAGMKYWARIAELYHLDLTVFHDYPDPTFRFMRLDYDGKIRMDCSSAAAMQGLVDFQNDYDLAWGNDPDFDRHGIVSPPVGLMNPNHYLAVAIDYLFKNRPLWHSRFQIGKTVVTTTLINRLAEDLGRQVYETPVGLKWFVSGLINGFLAFAGEESAGATFVRKDGTLWTTDKDGIILALLAAEIQAKTGLTPAAYYEQLVNRYGRPYYERIDVPASRKEKESFKKLNAQTIQEKELAGESIQSILTHAPGNQASIGGIKISTANGWFAARPSGTENIYKIYAESFLGPDHLMRLLEEAKSMVHRILSQS